MLIDPLYIALSAAVNVVLLFVQQHQLRSSLQRMR